MKVLVGMNQVMISPAVGVKTHVPGGAKLGQLVLPLLLQIQVAIYDHLANLIAYSHDCLVFSALKTQTADLRVSQADLRYLMSRWPSRFWLT